jgi:hypothetical protein
MRIMAFLNWKCYIWIGLIQIKREIMEGRNNAKMIGEKAKNYLNQGFN